MLRRSFAHWVVCTRRARQLRSFIARRHTAEDDACASYALRAWVAAVATRRRSVQAASAGVVVVIRRAFRKWSMLPAVNRDLYRRIQVRRRNQFLLNAIQ